MTTPHSNPEDLPTVAGEDADTAAAAPMSIGKVGRYKITRLIGEGGMGAVYEAEQDQPRRTVALKVIKAGFASPELLRRFALESQALGRLQHPGIAQIYDAGTADTGHGPQPYFAMEFIRGETLIEYVKKHRLNTNQRLEIIAKVCDAVHHAHQRGLIHRDLKPGNILVDETGQPKILDFGVARVTDSDAQATMQTDVGQLVGTLAYMSPEQVLADPLELDIRSDVYALGVILYQLLAERLPYDISKKIHEALHAIREEDPAKLSSVNRTYRGDIETIVAKALEKNKTRRYASAAELGADISHYLKDEPIIAQPPTTTYQLKKFARRHRALVIGLAAVFVVLVLGVVGSTWQAIRASRAEAEARLAQQAATVDRDKAVKAEGQAVQSEAQAKVERDKAIAEKQRADTESATAKAVSDFMQKSLFEQVTGGARGTVQDLSVSGALDRTAAKIDGAFKNQPLVEAGVRETVATAYASLSLFEKSEPQLERAVALRRSVQGEEDADVLKSRCTLAGIYAERKKYTESANLYEKILPTQKRVLGNDNTSTLKCELDLAAVYIEARKPEKALPLLNELTEIRTRMLRTTADREVIGNSLVLVQTLANVQKNSEALSLATRIYAVSRQSLKEDHPFTIAAKTAMGSLQLTLNGKSIPSDKVRATRDELLANQARVLDSQSAASLPQMIAMALSRTTVAMNQNQPEVAEAVARETLDAVNRVGQEDLNLRGILAGALAAQKKFAEAESALKKVVENPASKDTLPTVIPFALRSLAEGYRDEKKFAEAEPHLLKLVPLVLVSPGEGSQRTRVDIFLLAQNYVDQRKFVDAERVFTQLLDVQRRASGPEVIQTLATMASIGWIRLQEKRYADAEKSFREAAAILRRTAPNSWERANNDSMLGATLTAQKKFEEAEPLLLSGYAGIGTGQRSSNQQNTCWFTQDQAGEAIVQLYADWNKPDKAAEWREKIKKK